jgi:hypothetical protein
MSDSELLNEIEDVLTNLYSLDDEPFNTEELRAIVDSVVSIIDKRNNNTEKEK